MRSISKLILALYLVTTSIGHVQASSNPSDFSVAGTISRTQSDFQVTQIASDPYFHQQWYLNTMQIPQAWDYTTGSNIIVAVIDTGIELTHPEFAGRIWTNNNEIPNNNKDDDGNGYIDDYHGYNFAEKNSDVKDYHGHGTGIASLIAANSNNGQGIAGVNQQAIIMPVKGLNNAGGGEYGDVVKSIYYAVDNGARIINMSFGAAYPDANLKVAINYAINNNVAVICTQQEMLVQIGLPAAYSSVISVGSLSQTLKKSYFTNYGVGLDLTRTW
ncbi:MAG: S8 family serine peptidase [Patescibacteria group bacterium]